MKYFLDKYFEKTRGFYPFFKYCPKQWREYYLAKRAYNTLGYEYNWQNPKTLNEKIRWLIFYEKPELKSKLTDKILVKSYIASKLGKNHSAELYGIFNNIDEIDFSILPDSFALKANCGWRMNILVKDKKYIKENYKDIKRITNKWLNTDFELFSLEPQYRRIRKKLMIEHLRPVTKDTQRRDLQIYCFNGEPKYCEMTLLEDERNYCQIYDTDWKLQSFNHSSHFLNKFHEKPYRFEKILEQCKLLSAEFSFVRIDIAYDGDDINIAEMTFTPCSAIIPFHARETDLMLGNMLKLPN